ncbi:MAG: DJ-1/PfpI family protein [Methanothrix sp.]|nr:DJ-1/PfpI family protein [Methanothrix sp.]
MRHVLLCMAFMAALIVSASGQISSTTSCWMCPVCGDVYSLEISVPAGSQYYQTTLGSIMSLDPNNPDWYCPTCYTLGMLTFAGNFVLVPCEDFTEDETEYAGEESSEETGPAQTDHISPLFSSQIPSNATGFSRNLSGSVLMVVAPKNYQERELNIPREAFERSGLDVDVASKGVTTATSMGGESVSVDVDVRSVNISKYRAVVFVGGIGIEELKLHQDSDYVNLARSAYDRGMIVAAICLAPNILASAGLLTNRNATCADSTYLIQKNVNYTDAPVVRDGSIITGRDPGSSEEFAETIIAAVSEQSRYTTGQVTESGGALTLVGVGASSPKYRCTVCGYEYDPAVGDPSRGIHPGTPFDELPADWKCPQCSASKDKFVSD